MSRAEIMLDWDAVFVVSQASDDTEAGPPLQVSPYFHWKGWLDRSAGLLLLILCLPLIGLLVLLVRATSRGPGIYRQRRVGKDGQEFAMLKIRTMAHKAESRSGPVWTNGHDPRVTAVGKVLRALHLDELPQLWNVARGEMALIGPRPERPEFVIVLAEKVPRYLDRLRVQPGISGLAQVNLPPDTDIESVRRKLLLDLEYIEQGGLWLDLRIGLWTLLRPTGLNAAGWLGIDRHETPEARCGGPAAPAPHAIVSPDRLSSIAAEPTKENGAQAGGGMRTACQPRKPR